MNYQDLKLIQETRKLESAVVPCMAQPQGSELPQVGSEEDIIVDTLHNITNEPLEVLEAYVNNQIQQ